MSSVLLASTVRAAAFNVGVSELKGPATAQAQGLPYLVWYPTATAEKDIEFGRIKFTAARDAEPLKGEHPLVVLSHGSGGSSLGHWKTASFLAGRGYVVLTLVHAHDNAADPQGSSTLAVWQSRPREWSAALDGLLMSRFAPLIDRSRIVAMGFSAGAYTALVVGGARPSSLALDDYCMVHSADDVTCVEYRFWKRMNVRLGSWFGQRKEMLSASTDPRVRAVVVLAPPGQAIFTEAGLKELRVPALLMRGDRDDVLRYPNDASYIGSVLKDRVEYREVPGGHYAFLSFDPRPRGAGAAPAGGTSADGSSAVHERIAAFLARVLGIAPRGAVESGE